MTTAANRHAERENVTAAVTGGIDTGFATAFAGGNAWFPQLPTGRQVEVLRYAVLHIANNSSWLERDNANHHVFEWITIAIARSEVSDAEAIFVEAASSATDAEPEDQLRMFFQSHKIGSSNKDGITAGSLFNLARECGADFSPWEKTSAVSGQAVVVYVPGKEEQCRKRIDLIVAADPRTFTLGSPSGPLVI